MIFDFDAFLQNYLFVKNTLSFDKGSLLSPATKIFFQKYKIEAGKNGVKTF